MAGGGREFQCPVCSMNPTTTNWYEYMKNIWMEADVNHGLGPPPPATHSPGPYPTETVSSSSPPGPSQNGDAVANGERKGKNGDALAKRKGDISGKNKDAGKGYDNEWELI